MIGKLLAFLAGSFLTLFVGYWFADLTSRELRRQMSVLREACNPPSGEGEGLKRRVFWLVVGYTTFGWLS